MSHLPSRRLLLAGLTVAALAACAPDLPPMVPIFFRSTSTELEPEAKKALDDFADEARKAPLAKVRVAGYAERLQLPGNQELADRRAQVVADALVQRGISRSRIVITPREATANDPGVESRRVELTIGR